MAIDWRTEQKIKSFRGNSRKPITRINRNRIRICKICSEQYNLSSVYFCEKCLGIIRYIEKVGIEKFHPTSIRGLRVKRFLLSLR